MTGSTYCCQWGLFTLSLSCNGRDYFELQWHFNVIYKCTVLPLWIGYCTYDVLLWCDNTKGLQLWVMSKHIFINNYSRKGTVGGSDDDAAYVYESLGQSAVRRERRAVAGVPCWISRWRSCKVPANLVISLCPNYKERSRRVGNRYTWNSL